MIKAARRDPAQHLYPAADRLVEGHQSGGDAGGAGGQGGSEPATQYVKAGYDPQAFIARLAEIVCHDNFTEMHAFKHHQSIVEEYNTSREPWPVCLHMRLSRNIKAAYVIPSISRARPRYVARTGRA
jgi:hypothetical protein